MDYVTKNSTQSYKYHEPHIPRVVPFKNPPCIDADGNCSYELRAAIREIERDRSLEMFDNSPYKNSNETWTQP